MTALQPLHFSQLKHIARSPAHYAHALRTMREDTVAFRLGRATHSLLLGGPLVQVWEGASRRGKAWDAWRADQSPDAIILLESEMDRVRDMAEAVRNNRHAAPLIEGMTELNLEWRGSAVTAPVASTLSETESSASSRSRARAQPSPVTSCATQFAMPITLSSPGMGKVC